MYVSSQPFSEFLLPEAQLPSHLFTTKRKLPDMAAPTEFSQDAVLGFMLEKGGKVRNHELVKYFKPFLTNPATKGVYKFLNYPVGFSCTRHDTLLTE